MTDLILGFIASGVIAAGVHVLIAPKPIKDKEDPFDRPCSKGESHTGDCA
ncbi:hypothetical protein GCM10012287_02790 [Streptomyces daqingensis]|uniref:Uncharacterized protein n=1 Tax=Streptomyces daqingensis TaxID=1472640 RepID=A0ABQ2LRE6_9ACTN|nr:hypothetical protein [Streptomyces daqingensis]GGO42283.1 hypothetical protein GCM10012287_02790 [Streptomyces daqingensis]